MSEVFLGSQKLSWPPMRKMKRKMKMRKQRTKNDMLSPTVIGVVLHLLGLKYNFGQVEVQRGEAELDFNLTEIGLHWSCTR